VTPKNSLQEWQEDFSKPRLFDADNPPQHRRKKRAVSPGTVARYNYYISRYLDYLKAQELPNSMNSLIDFFNEFKEDSKANTAKIARAGLKAGFLNIPRYKNDLRFKMIIDSAFNYLETEQPDRRIDKNSVLSPQDLDSLFEAMPPRLRAVCEFCYYTACRISEALNARNKNVSENGYVFIKIQGTKSRKERTLKCDKEVFREVKAAYPKTKKYIFETASGRQLYQQNIYNQLNYRNKKEIAAGELGKYQHIVNGKPLSPHAFRHARATHLLNDGWDVTAVADWLGNTPQMVMAVYGHNQVDVKKLQEQDRERFKKAEKKEIVKSDEETLFEFEQRMLKRAEQRKRGQND